VHDTHFVVAHFHYVLIGGMLFPLIAGIYHWLPHVSGRLPSETLARTGFWLTFVGFNGTFLVMHWTGLLGMPRRVYTYDAGLGWDLPNLVSSVFSFVMAFGIATLLLDLVLHGRHGRKAPPNPWYADTLEWASGTPPRSYNFASLPRIGTRHPLWDQPELPETIASGRHALAQAAHGRRETLGVDPVSGRVREVIHLPGNSWWPLAAGGLLALLCIALLLKLYTPALVTALVALAVMLRWSWENGAHPKAAGGDAHDLPQGLKLHARTFDGPGLWGMGMTMLADTALYGSLLFGWLYLWTVVPDGRPPAQSPLGTWPLTVVTGLFGAGLWTLQAAVQRLRAGNDGGLRMRLWASAALGAAACAALGWLLAVAGLEPTVRAHDAVLAFTLVFLLLHGALATVLAALQALRVHHGHVSLAAPYEPAVVAMLWRFCALATAAAWVLMAMLPLAFGSPR
jgi:cytochrome c oxidase subunit I+III